MKQFLERFASLQPAVFRGVIVAVVALLASVGILVSPELADALVGLVGSLSALTAAFWIRPAVTPNSKVLAYTPDPEHPRVIASGEGTTTAPDGVILDAVRYDPKHDAPE